MTIERDSIACGEYRLLERIGSGGMGTVWRAEHPIYERDVAIKVMSSEVAEADKYRDWFRREIWAHARLTHRNIVRMFDLGEVGPEAQEATEGELVEGSPFYVMEYSPQGTLRSGVVLRGWQPVAEVLAQLFEGLAYAHARDVIHRDLKPGNILCFSVDPLLIKMADLGLAFAFDQRDHDVRDQKLGPAGTVDYMAPEQIRGEWRRYGAWTDLYAVGCIAFELVTGRRPYPEKDSQSISDAHIERPIPPVDPLFEIPERAAAWIRTLLAKEPADRFWCAADAARALAEITRGFEPREPQGVVSSRDRESDAEATTVRQEGETAEQTDLSPSRGGKPTDLDPEASLRSSLDRTAPRSPRMPGKPPAFPEDWRRAYQQQVNGQDAPPLGLFGLKEVPFVDREEERDLLWKTLSTVVEDGEIRAVAITGRKGIGKTRLADWIGRRGTEVGACLRIEVRHSRSTGSGEGLPGMLQEIFGTWDLTAHEARQQIRRVLETWYDQAYDQETIEDDAQALVEWVNRGRGEAGYTDPTLRFDVLPGQFRIIERVLAELARRRPVCLQFDDIHRSRPTAGFVHHLLESDRNFGGLVVMTMPQGADGQTGPAGQILSHVLEHPRTRGLNLSALRRRDHRRLVEGMLGLREELIEQVVERTGGTPLFAIEVVRDWVEQGALEWTDEGYRLSEETDRGLPDDLHELWERRLRHLTRDLEETRREEAIQSVEIGAMFGTRVDREEWWTACQHAEICPVELLFERMIEQGLAMPEPDGWRFAHGMLVESLVRRATDRGRAGQFSRACTAAIEGEETSYL